MYYFWVDLKSHLEGSFMGLGPVESQLRARLFTAMLTAKTKNTFSCCE